MESLLVSDQNDLSDYYESHTWDNRKICAFDDELASKAEQSSTQWVDLFKYSSLDADVNNVSKIIQKTGLNSQEENTFSHQSTTHTTKYDSIADKNKLVLLDKKYFEFETSVKAVAVSVRDVETDLNMYSTVFDHEDSTHDEVIDSEPLPEKTFKAPPNPSKPLDGPSKSGKKNKTNKKKGRTQYRPFETDSLPSTDQNPGSFVGAPPGVRVTKSLQTRHFDLSKSGNSSLNFRL